jgi:hypothetical protein
MKNSIDEVDEGAGAGYLDSDDNPASNHYMSLNSAPWLTKHVASILALVTLILSFALFFILIFYPLQAEKKDIVIYILGVLSAIDTQIFSFYFGSSKDAEVKNRMIHHQMNKRK